MVIYISTKFHANILDGIKVIEQGYNSVKNVGGASVLILCMSSESGLYFYQVS